MDPTDREKRKFMTSIHDKTFRFGCAIAVLAAMPSLAENEDTIARCAKIGSVGDRILCLEDALRESSHQVAAAPPDADLAATSAIGNEASLPIESEVSSSAAEAETVLTADSSLATENYGLKEQRPPREANTIQVTVTSVSKNLGNRLIFETEEGHVWVQTDQRTVRYEDTPFKAEIRPASMSSFFLKPASGGASVRVRREK